MKTNMLRTLGSLIGLHLAVNAIGVEPPTPPVLVVARVVERTVTIQLGEALLTIVPVPIVPIRIEPGTRVRLLALSPGDKYGPVKWFKDGNEFNFGGGTLEFADAKAEDTGTYVAAVKGSDGRLNYSGGMALLIRDQEAQRLGNVSALVRLDNAQQSFSCGFMVEASPWPVLILLRGVGPGLSDFGVRDVLRAPKLVVYDMLGKRVAPVRMGSLSVSVEEVSKRVGAFPLVAGGGDVADLYYVPGGAYTVEVSSENGQSGAVLVEVYKAP